MANNSHATPLSPAESDDENRTSVSPKIIEAADLGTRGGYALTCEWPDGSETVEKVSEQAAKLLGYVPDEAAAPTPAAPPSGPAAVAVEERQKLARLIETRLRGVLPEDQDLVLEDTDWDLILRCLASPQDHGAVRDAALEEAALWHESHIQGGHCGEASDEMIVRQRVERHHRRSAEGIRALKTGIDEPGREGEGSGGDKEYPSK